MRIGVFVALNKNIDSEFAKLYKNGFSTCQIGCWDMSLYTDENAEAVRAAAAKYNIEITALWCGWSGPAIWNFYEGPLTLGLVPAPYRLHRMQELMKGSDFAEKINVTDIITHMGFLPEIPTSSEYSEVVAAIRVIAEYCKNKGQYLLFETGQETAVTLRRTIEDVGTGNLGINLDPANLILYGKSNPVDALGILGKYVRNVHGKDGCYPTDGKNLGEEMPLGKGQVNYPAFIAKLKEIGYDGPITIEREITGDEQIKDILEAKSLLEELIAR
jgi:sugar phosphate isomerase/epimerase